MLEWKKFWVTLSFYILIQVRLIFVFYCVIYCLWYLFSCGDKSDYLNIDQLVSFLNEVRGFHTLTYSLLGFLFQFFKIILLLCLLLKILSILHKCTLFALLTDFCYFLCHILTLLKVHIYKVFLCIYCSYGVIDVVPFENCITMNIYRQPSLSLWVSVAASV